jgi:hypothetical protein
LTPRKGFVDSFALKIIAIVAMTADHFGIVFWDQLPQWGRTLAFMPGGMTFPIMAFLLTVGYAHTRDVKKYGLRLLVFAAIALVPFVWAFDMMELNVLFTLLLGLLAIYLYDHMKNRPLLMFALLAIFLVSLKCDWAGIGVVMVLCYHVIKQPVARVVVPVMLAWFAIGGSTVEVVLANPTVDLMWYMPYLAYPFIGCTATIPLLLAYNGRRGRPLKYFFYAYYPAHITLLALMHRILYGL